MTEWLAICPVGHRSYYALDLISESHEVTVHCREAGCELVARLAMLLPPPG